MLAGLILGCAPSALADFFSTLFPHDIDVITVTDVTEAGRAYPQATPAKPVYYKIIDLGQESFGRSWAGESVPDRRVARKWLMNAMAGQGYRLADEQHPPAQLLVFAWGLGGPGPTALKFLGGEKADLLWENEQYGGLLNPRVLLRGMQRTGITGKIWDFSQSNLFFGLVRSYTMDSETAPTVTMLWETRFGCPADGLSINNAMPLMIKAAAINFGRETKMPVGLNATDVFGGHVDIGELKVLGTTPAPGSDPAKNEPATAPASSR